MACIQQVRGSVARSLQGEGVEQEITQERKNNRGGKRAGAGRKPNYLKRLGIKAITAAEILAHVNEPELWQGLLTHKSPDVRLRTLQYLTDRRDGKAKQAIEVAGGLLHAHTVYRDPMLAALSPEELQALDGLTRKLALPSPDAPHNQIESKPAIEAEVLASEATEGGERGQQQIQHMAGGVGMVSGSSEE